MSPVPLELLIMLVVVLLLTFLGVRHRLAFRIGTRNAFRARTRTILLVLGLLVATTIVSGSLVVGDTVSQVATHYTVLAVGYNDELVGNQAPSGAYPQFSYSVYTNLTQKTTGDHQISAMAPEIVGSVAAFDPTSKVPKPGLYLIGANANQTSQLGNFETDSGTTLNGPATGKVLIDDLAASELNASAGDIILLYGAGPTPTVSVVQAVVQDNMRAAFPTGGLGNFGTVFTSLSQAQQIENFSTSINLITVTNVGDQANRLSIAPAVSGLLNSTLTTIPGAQGLYAQQLLVTSLATANSDGSSVTTLFFALGLFAIVAGAVLIIGIFVLLTEERKGEMGIMRAIGLKGRELVYSYLFEGAIYSAGGALAGTFAGIGIGYVLINAAIILNLIPTLPSAAILQSFTVTTQTLITAYVVGFLITLATVAFAGVRSSHVNIVRAIRDIPEPPPALRTYTSLAILGMASLIIGALLYLTTYSGTSDLSYPIVGGALVVAGCGLIASRFIRNRIAFSLTGAGLLVWGGTEPLHTALLGSAHGGGVFIVFTDGIVMVTGALLLYAFNSPVLSTGLLRLIGGRSQRTPVARIGLSYPSRRPARTTITLAIFTLVIFTLAAVAAAGSTVNASLATTLQSQSGGYTLVAYSNAAIPDLPSLVANNATLAPYFSAVVPLISGGVYVNVTGYPGNPYPDLLRSGPLGEPSSSSLYTTNQYTFAATENGMSASAVFAELQSTPGVAIVDQSYSTVANNIAVGSSGPHPKVNPGDKIVIDNPATGNHTNVTVLGVMSQSLLSGVFVSPATAASLGFTRQNVFFFTVPPSVSATRALQLAQDTFFPYGLVVLSISGLLAKSISSNEALVGLLQIFVGMGLTVGIAAMGIVALRAVVERRREIGMLRANGFTPRMILKSFILEYSFIALVGIAIGAGLGLLLIWNLTQRPSAASQGVGTFAVPWLNLLLIFSLAYGLSMLAVTQPSLRAANLPPAEAVRPTE